MRDRSSPSRAVGLVGAQTAVVPLNRHRHRRSDLQLLALHDAADLRQPGQVDHRLVEASRRTRSLTVPGFRKVTWPSCPVSWPGTLRPSSLPPVTMSTPPGRPSNTVIGNRIEYTFLRRPERLSDNRRVSFILMACILVIVLLYVPGPDRRTWYEHHDCPSQGPRIGTGSATGSATTPQGVRSDRVRLPAASGGLRSRFSFNDAGRTNIVWQGFTLDNWLNPVAHRRSESVVNSIVGADRDYGVDHSRHIDRVRLVRYQFRGRGTTNLTIFLPMATPEVVLGSSLLALFLNIFVPLGFGPSSSRARHVLHPSFVVVTVKARLASPGPPGWSRPAMDLYAIRRQAFRKITLPLVAPGIAAAGCWRSVSASTTSSSRTSTPGGSTFPKFVYVSATRGIPAQANVIASAMFFIALAS